MGYRVLKNGIPTVVTVAGKDEAFMAWRYSGYAEATKFTPSTMKEKGIPFKDDVFVSPNNYEWFSLEKLE